MIGLHEQLESALAGRYQVERELGRGGMAIVYLARDLKHGRHVAVKLLRPELASSLGAERFLREINVAAGLSHPNVVALYDSGEADGLLYYVMPHVEGESLRDRLEREGQLPIDEAMAILRQVADALDHAHGRGVVHRDIKPENILLRGGHALVADFGLARALYTAASSPLTQSGMAIGTPAYMSPEQASGEARVDGRTDVYALGCVLFEMIAGVPPFRGATAQALIAHHVATAPPSVCAERSTCPDAIDVGIRRAMAKVPADRFRTAGEFVRALSASVSPAGSRDRRRPWAGVALAGIAVAAALAIAVSTDPFASPPRLQRRAEAALAAGDWDAALAALRRGAARGDRGANASLAELLLILGRDSTDEWHRAVATAIGEPDGAPQPQARTLALGALARGDLAAACPTFRALANGDPRDVGAATALAMCLVRDSAVVPDVTSPSGWRFRSDYGEAARMYYQALSQRPPGHPLREIVFRGLVTVLITEPGQTRRGFAASDRAARFGAYPTLRGGAGGDAVVFVPFRIADLAIGRPGGEAPRNEDAIAHNRSRLRVIARLWATEFPSSAQAHAILARALEQAGEIGPTRPGAVNALDAVRRARALTEAPIEQIRLVQTEIRLLIKQSRFEDARRVADSVLARLREPGAHESGALAALAALTGRAHLTAELLARVSPELTVLLPDGRPYHPHPNLGATAQRLLGYSAVGAPRDSIAALRDRVEQQLRSYVSFEQQDSVREALLARSLSLAVPALGPGIVAGLSGRTNQVVRMQRALARGDTGSVRASLDSVQRLRRSRIAGATTLDRTFQEAWLRAAIRDTGAAVDQLDLPLSALATLRTEMLRYPAETAALVRAMRLRANIAAHLGDGRTARRWSTVVDTLWRNADREVLQEESATMLRPTTNTLTMEAP